MKKDLIELVKFFLTVFLFGVMEYYISPIIDIPKDSNNIATDCMILALCYYYVIDRKK